MKSKNKKMLLGELETLVMKEMWKLQRATVYDVLHAINPQKKLAYTTVLTTLRNLEKKGLLKHEIDGRSYVYQPLVNQQDIAHSSLKVLLERYFDGSKIQLVNALFAEESLTKEQFEKLRREIMELRRKEE